MDKLRVGVIGCGGHAQTHFQMIAAEPRLHLAGIAEIDPKRLADNTARHCPERSFADYRQMLDEGKLDLVHITTLPAHLTALVVECLDRGLHVSVEKPPGMSATETAQMAQAARQSRGKALVSFNRRYIPQVLALRRLLKERGGTVQCSATYHKNQTILGQWRGAGLVPDPVVCDAIHHVDLLRWLAGAGQERAAVPVSVYSEVADGPRPAAHRHQAVVRFDNGAVGSLMSHYGVGFRIQRAEAHAEDFSAYLELSGEPQCELYQALPGEGESTRGTKLNQPLDLEAVGGPGYNEVRHFTDCILEDRTPWSTLDDAAQTMVLAEAIRSGHKGPLG
ncbi:MAG: Gfo/Idh/MocA family oxidoreductase [Candidatus Latescibacteria bacterium]|nr:Gfo/Idh/MocA family oxidoreductase [Candidatus Latescibacterota bacterium]